MQNKLWTMPGIQLVLYKITTFGTDMPPYECNDNGHTSGGLEEDIEREKGLDLVCDMYWNSSVCKAGDLHFKYWPR